MSVIERLKSNPNALVCTHWGDPQSTNVYFAFDGWVRQKTGEWVSSDGLSPHGLRIYFAEDNNGAKPFIHSKLVKASELLSDLSDKEPLEMTDPVEKPSHYNRGGQETIDRIEAVIEGYQSPVLGALIWQVLKYIDRAPHKRNTLEDLKKAKQYLSRAIAKLEGRDGWE